MGVVRLFVSGESWYEAPRRSSASSRALRAAAGDCAPATGPAHGAAQHGVLPHRPPVVLCPVGRDSPKRRRGDHPRRPRRTFSRTPEKEDVLILAHGPGDDAENQRWLASIDARAAEIRASLLPPGRGDDPAGRLAREAKDAEQRVVDFVPDRRRRAGGRSSSRSAFSGSDPTKKSSRGWSIPPIGAGSCLTPTSPAGSRARPKSSARDRSSSQSAD